MQRTVREHLDNLELLVGRLNDELMQQEDMRLRNELEAKVRAAELALAHYRTALKLEQSMAIAGDAKS
jgi:hypothetical protein